MDLTLEEIAAHIDRLPAKDQALLMERIGQSLEPIDPDIEAAWLEEAERRCDAIDRGEETCVPWETVRKDLGLA